MRVLNRVGVCGSVCARSCPSPGRRGAPGSELGTWPVGPCGQALWPSLGLRQRTADTSSSQSRELAAAKAQGRSTRKRRKENKCRAVRTQDSKKDRLECSRSARNAANKAFHSSSWSSLNPCASGDSMATSCGDDADRAVRLDSLPLLLPLPPPSPRTPRRPEDDDEEAGEAAARRESRLS